MQQRANPRSTKPGRHLPILKAKTNRVMQGDQASQASGAGIHQICIPANWLVSSAKIQQLLVRLFEDHPCQWIWLPSHFPPCMNNESRHLCGNQINNSDQSNQQIFIVQ